MQTKIEEISAGDIGVNQTISKICEMVDRYSLDFEIISKAREIIRDTPSKDKIAEADALFWFVKENIRYCNDPLNAELLQSPIVTISSRAGDCDDMVILLASLNKAIGNDVAYITVALPNREKLSHIFLTVHANGQCNAYDPTDSDSYPGWYPKPTGRVRIFYSEKDWEDSDGLSGFFSSIKKFFKKLGQQIQEYVLDPIKDIINPIYNEIKRIERRVRNEKDRFLDRVSNAIADFESKIGPWGKMLLMAPIYMTGGNPLSILEFARDPSLTNLGNAMFGQNAWERLDANDWAEINGLGKTVGKIFSKIAEYEGSLHFNPLKIYEDVQLQKETIENVIDLKRKKIEELKEIVVTLNIEIRAKREALAKLEIDVKIFEDLLSQRRQKDSDYALQSLSIQKQIDNERYKADKEILAYQRNKVLELRDIEEKYLNQIRKNVTLEARKWIVESFNRVNLFRYLSLSENNIDEILQSNYIELIKGIRL